MSTVRSQITISGNTARVLFTSNSAEGYTSTDLDTLERAIVHARRQLERIESECYRGQLGQRAPVES